MDRAQVHTLEAFIAALLIVGALLFASQATAVTPLSASTSNQHIENQQQQMADDLLSITARDGTLQEALLYWNESYEEHNEGHFAHTPPERGTYSSIFDGDFDHPLEEPLNESFGSGVYAYNIELRYLDTDENFSSTDMVVMGTPSDNAVTASRTVTLYANDTITGEGSPIELHELNYEDDEIWAPNVNESSLVYNVVEVRMTIWRM